MLPLLSIFRWFVPSLLHSHKNQGTNKGRRGLIIEKVQKASQWPTSISRAKISLVVYWSDDYERGREVNRHQKRRTQHFLRKRTRLWCLSEWSLLLVVLYSSISCILDKFTPLCAQFWSEMELSMSALALFNYKSMYVKL